MGDLSDCLGVQSLDMTSLLRGTIWRCIFLGISMLNYIRHRNHVLANSITSPLLLGLQTFSYNSGKKFFGIY